MKLLYNYSGILGHSDIQYWKEADYIMTQRHITTKGHVHSFYVQYAETLFINYYKEFYCVGEG